MQSLQPSITMLIFTSFIQIDDSTLTFPCGRRLAGANPLITLGRTAVSWPWHVAIYHKKDKLEYKCGGTVIGQNSVLTAAHCVSNYNDPMEPSKVSLSLGRFNLRANESREQSFAAAKIVLHPDYDFRDFSNDIAIVRLPTKAVFNNYVQPICLWQRHKTELSEVVGKDGTVVGWGRMETNKVTDLLQQASLRVVNSWKCLATNRGTFGSFLSKTNFCAGFRNGTNVCNGDSGGSLTFEANGSFYIRGIVSLVVGNVTTQSCNSFEYAIFTDVAKFLSWIKKTAKICIKRVKCEPRRDTYGKCTVVLRYGITERNCEIIFTVNTKKVGALRITGVLRANSDLSDNADKFENLKQIEISAEIEALKRKMFTSFKKIEALFFARNKLTEIGANVFNDLTKLLRLGISFNPLHKIHGDLFEKLLNLEEISLSHNDINVLPEGVFSNNAKLKFIWLNNNEITEIPPDVFQEQLDLERVYLHFNQLTILPEGIFRNNAKLESLSLGNNHIATIKVDFRHLENLIHLQLTGNACIDENFDFELSNETYRSEMQNNVWRNC